MKTPDNSWWPVHNQTCGDKHTAAANRANKTWNMEVEDPQKTILKQFLTKGNTINMPGGATTLKPELLKQLTGEEEDFNMADWLAMFNKQDQGESRLEIDDEGRARASRSGILDKATSNIQRKEVWPQKNLLEDWADEEILFN